MNSVFWNKAQEEQSSVLNYSAALHTSLTHEPIFSEATQQTVFGSLLVSASPQEQDKSPRALVCVWPLGQVTSGGPWGYTDKCFGMGMILPDHMKQPARACRLVHGGLCSTGSMMEGGHGKSILPRGPQAVPSCLAECHSVSPVQTWSHLLKCELTSLLNPNT